MFQGHFVVLDGKLVWKGCISPVTPKSRVWHFWSSDLWLSRSGMCSPNTYKRISKCPLHDVIGFIGIVFVPFSYYTRKIGITYGWKIDIWSDLRCRLRTWGQQHWVFSSNSPGLLTAGWICKSVQQLSRHEEAERKADSPNSVSRDTEVSIQAQVQLVIVSPRPSAVWQITGPILDLETAFDSPGHGLSEYIKNFLSEHNWWRHTGQVTDHIFHDLSSMDSPGKVAVSS